MLTAHRAGNVDDPERLSALVDLIAALPRPVLFPLHPRTHLRLQEADLLDRLQRLDGVTLTGPLGYAELTDRGNRREEAQRQ